MAKKIIKITEGQLKQIIEDTILKEARTDRRFRASLYIDIFVPATDDLEEDREIAKQQVEQIEKEIPNSYMGGIAYFPTGQFPDPKELERL